MSKKTLWKDIRKSFTTSWGRFFSILLLMMLGSFALVGLWIAGPDMRATGETYFKQYHLTDLTVIGEDGLMHMIKRRFSVLLAQSKSNLVISKT